MFNRFTTLEDHLDILEGTLKFGHMAPTAPDTLACYPYADTDPFVLDGCPHVYFTGNAPSFQHRLSHGPQGQKTLLVAVPRFCVTGSCVLVDLGTLECRELKIDTRLDEPSSHSAREGREMEGKEEMEVND